MFSFSFSNGIVCASSSSICRLYIELKLCDASVLRNRPMLLLSLVMSIVSLTFLGVFPEIYTSQCYKFKSWQYINPYNLNREWSVFATSIDIGQFAHQCSLTRLYSVDWKLQVLILISLKNGHLKKTKKKEGSWIIPIKIFSRLRCNQFKCLMCYADRVCEVLISIGICK